MKLSTKTCAVPLAMALAGSLALAACGASNETSSGSGSSSSGSAAQLSGSLNGAGSSAQQAAMQGWSAGFNKEQPNVTVNYDPVGSGGGRTQFIAGGVDFAGSDAALKTDPEVPDAQKRCGGDIFELPNYISAIAVAYNLPSVKNLNLAPDTIAKIFNGSITTWNDPAIAADNPGVTLPSTQITPVHRSDNSGTTQNFTDYLSKAAPTVWTSPPSGDWPSQSGEAGAQTSGVVSALKAGEGTIGYIDESQAEGLGVAKVKVGSDYVAPTPEAAAAVVESSKVQAGRSQYDYALDINRTPTSADQYPIVLVSYHIGCLKNAADKADLLKAFLGYVISSDGQKAAAQQAGSAPITDTIRQQNQKAVDAITAQ
ncbi:MAG: phosphate ABC transporter substrate-binding protein PstS [Geodermatophilales bacterium]|nr:phosphate ABC transporter substrate-binding protein PstS [Geodermatophilales bacterium]